MIESLLRGRLIVLTIRSNSRCWLREAEVFRVSKGEMSANLEGMLTPVDARRRWFGAFYLFISLGLLIWGVTLLNSFLMRHPLLFVLYWASCAVCTGLALLHALVDMLIMRKRSRDEQIALAQNSLAEIEEEKKKRGLS